MYENLGFATFPEFYTLTLTLSISESMFRILLFKELLLFRHLSLAACEYLDVLIKDRCRLSQRRKFFLIEKYIKTTKLCVDFNYRLLLIS